jgi:pilus assembly protein Flp/PilA
MSQPSRLVCQLLKDENGASLVEYTVLLGIMLVGVIAIIIGVGKWINNHWSLLNAQLT